MAYLVIEFQGKSLLFSVRVVLILDLEWLEECGLSVNVLNLPLSWGSVDVLTSLELTEC